MAIAAAAMTAARLRFRPVVMTSAAMFFGMLPLVVSSGAGAKGNMAIGMGVLGGLLVGTVALLLFVPVLFCLFQRLDEALRKRQA